MPVTLQNIADIAGVSRGVVSAVLNKKSRNSRVSEATRERIEAIARELAYRPNVTAQHLRDKETRTVHVVIPSFTLFKNEHYTGIVISLQEHLRAHGYTLQMTSLDTAFSDNRLINHIKTDGLLMFHWGGREKVIDELCSLDVPLILVNGRYDGKGAGSRTGNVYADIRSGMADLARAVVAAGHRRITYVNTYPADISHRDAHDGLMDVFGSRPDVSFNSLPFAPDSNSADSTGLGVQLGMQGLDAALDTPERPTVVMFNDNLIAMAAVRRAGQLGLRIPDDIAITGAGDSRLDPICPVLLATTENRAAAVGTAAAEMMLEALSGNREALRRQAVPVKAIVRESIGRLKN